MQKYGVDAEKKVREEDLIDLYLHEISEILDGSTLCMTLTCSYVRVSKYSQIKRFPYLCRRYEPRSVIPNLNRAT